MRSSKPDFARSERDREALAKSWLVELIGNTPLPEVEGLALSWISRHASPLIADIAEAMNPLATPTAEERSDRQRREAELARLREGAEAAELIPRDLAALQILLIENLRREIPEREPGEFARSVSRLAEIFGELQSSVAKALVDERSGASNDPLTGLRTAAHLDEHLRILLAEHRRYDHVFAIATVEIDGLSHINEAYGRESGDRMLTAIAGLLVRQVRAADQAYRISGDEFCVVAPHQTPTGMRTVGQRLATLIDSSQGGDGPRLGVSVGIATCPEDGDAPQELIDAAQEATYAAKAAGLEVMVRSQMTQTTED
ncbi:GGDEF domain-containing protein [Thermoleophilia bacterium SCSIO 60948]|nr:GGDEF domain-containing protein [Thermoleophilia bacterium SCSIO 60948]